MYASDPAVTLTFDLLTAKMQPLHLCPKAH